MITKFRERWEKLKESAKRKRDAKAAAQPQRVLLDGLDVILLIRSRGDMYGGGLGLELGFGLRSRLGECFGGRPHQVCHVTVL